MHKPKRIRASGAELIAMERQRQIDEEGWSLKHDREHSSGELALAAICYATPQKVFVKQKAANVEIFKDPWPFEARWDKRYRQVQSNVIPDPQSYSTAQRLDLLIKAGALIAAEIDRIRGEK